MPGKTDLLRDLIQWDRPKWHTLVEPTHVSEEPNFALLVMVQLISVLCVVHLWWRHDATTPQKLSLTLMVLIPVLGPLLYGYIYKPAERSVRPRPSPLPRARALAPRSRHTKRQLP